VLADLFRKIGRSGETPQRSNRRPIIPRLGIEFGGRKSREDSMPEKLVYA